MTNAAWTRRAFVKWSALLSQGGPAFLHGAGKLESQQGDWTPVVCFNHCGGRCPLSAYVVDGTVLRLKSDDTHADSPDYPQQRACARGRAQRFQVFGADRLKYPMKRRNWEPGGGKRQLRGRDDWVRISWDEALDLVAAETKRIKKAHGNSSILVAARGHICRTLALYGGYADAWGQVSFGAWPEAYKHITGVPGIPYNTGNDRLRLREAKLIVIWGANPAWSSGGSATWQYLEAKKRGTKFIVVDPHYSDSAQALADQWIPIRPGTDSALLLGMAHHILEKGLHDQSFLDRYCVGFDREHMPAGADPAESFKDYVLGVSDGTPKTPEWASAICGTDPGAIRRFATEYAKTKPALIQAGGAPARTNRGEQFPHALMTIALMTGNIGIPGSGVGPNMYMWAGNAGPPLIRAGSPGVPRRPKNPLNCRINNCELWNAVLTGEYTVGAGKKKQIDIRMIYYENGAALNQKVGAMKGIEAHRKVEFVVTQNYVFTPNAQYSDIVLPITTPWEQDGGVMKGNREILIWGHGVTQPLFEAKDDVWVAAQIGKRLGLDPSEIDPLPQKQQLFNQVNGAKVIQADGKTFEPLVTVTEEDLDRLGVTGKPQRGRIPLREFEKKGIYQVPRSPGDNLGFTAFEEFRQDPDRHSLDTPSGKFEIHSRSLADSIHAVGFNDKSPLPAYEPAPEGYEETRAGDFPLQLVTIHHPRRAHTAFDNIPQMREAFEDELMMNPADAAERNIESGDTVLVRSRHGKLLRRVLITSRIMPGVTILGQGAWIDLDHETGIDRGGATNILNGDIPTGQGNEGFNTCIVQVEKYGKPLPPDWRRPRKIAAPEERHA